MQTNRGAPTPPIAFGHDAGTVRDHLQTARVGIDDSVLRRLRDACAEVVTEPAVIGEASRDWWPLAMIWALDDQVAARADVVVRPTSTDEVAQVLAVCS